MAKLQLIVRHTKESQQEIFAILDELKEGYKNRILRVAAERAARRTVPAVKVSMMAHKSSGATQKALTSKVVRIRGKSIYVGVVGAGADPKGTDGKYTVIHPMFGYRSAGEWRQTTPGRNRPQAYGHLIEDGRKAVAMKGKVLAFVVSQLDARRRKPKTTGYTGRLNKQYRVGNGYVIFTRSAKGYSGTQPVRSNLPELEKNLIAALKEASVTELQRLAARAISRGSSLYRS